MKQVTELAYAKLNLSLDVLYLRSDSYHEMDMLMQSVSLCDTLTLTLCDSPAILLCGDSTGLPTDERNLAYAAALRFFEALGRPPEGLSISLHKRIPVCAGTAGGSSDAAATLRGLNRLYDMPFSLEALCEIGALVGSDVPYCVYGKTARAQGRGERLTPLPALPPCHIVLCKPDFAIASPVLFQRIDACQDLHRPDTAGLIEALEHGDLAALAQRLANVFVSALEPWQRGCIDRIHAQLLAFGALGASMSGTGPTVFGIFTEETQAQQAAAALSQMHKDTFLTHPV